MIALVRTPSPNLDRCELLHRERQPIDVDLVRAQHRRYTDVLARLGCRVFELPELPDQPDGVFVEDTAVVLDEIAILTRPGPESRRPELESVERALARFRPIARIEPPGILDGGDVLCVGRSIYVGVSTRTDALAIAQFRAIVEPRGYGVTPVEVNACLHLKSAATQAGPDTVLVNPDWVPDGVFDRHRVIEVAAAEPHAANVVVVGDTLLCSASFPETNRELVRSGLAVETVPCDEIAKAEGALTCCSLLFPPR